jgi:hypothetical protein
MDPDEMFERLEVNAGLVAAHQRNRSIELN